MIETFAQKMSEKGTSAAQAQACAIEGQKKATSTLKQARRPPTGPGQPWGRKLYKSFHDINVSCVASGRYLGRRSRYLGRRSRYPKPKAQEDPLQPDHETRLDRKLDGDAAQHVIVLSSARLAAVLGFYSHLVIVKDSCFPSEFCTATATWEGPAAASDTMTSAPLLWPSICDLRQA